MKPSLVSTTTYSTTWSGRRGTNGLKSAALPRDAPHDRVLGQRRAHLPATTDRTPPGKPASVARRPSSSEVVGDLKTIEQKFSVLKAHCESAGRDYESIHRTVTLACAIGETDEQAQGENPPGTFRAGWRVDWHS